MKFSNYMWLILPLVIVGVLYASLQTSYSAQTVRIVEPSPSIETKTRSANPAPENVQVLGETTSTNPTPQPTTTPKTEFVDKVQLYNLIQSYRRENNRTLLKVNASLETSAKRKISDMIENDYFRHADTENRESWYLFQTAGYNYLTAGENLSSGNNTAWEVFSAWQNSPEHNSQLLKPEYEDMGIALDCKSYVVRRKPSCIVVLHVGSR